MQPAVIRRLCAALAAAIALALLGGQSALALGEPTVPEPVATYFATGLMPRLADLYGPGKKADSGIVFDSSSMVGTIHRVFSWTAAYLAKKHTDTTTELTNDWVASVTVKGQVAGLATVWINPSSDQPELADFDLGPGLASALAAAPKGMVLIRDDSHSAWFATDGKALVPLVSGSSGVATATTIAAYQKTLTAVPTSAAVSTATTNGGLVIAGVVLGLVVIVLAVFVLLPDRRRRANRAAEAESEPVVEPADEDAVVPVPVDEDAVVPVPVDEDAVVPEPVDAPDPAPESAPPAKKPDAPRKPRIPKPPAPAE
ncbi:MAG: hypothetical protein V4479_10110 [Actinomycetota bacterium]